MEHNSKQRMFATAVTAIAMACLSGTWAAPTAHAANPLTTLVDAAAQRLQTADAVAASKYRTGGAVDDPQREQQVLDTVASAAQTNHIDPAYVVAAFRNQIDATSSVEHTRFAQWKLDPGAAPAAAPELAETRTTIDRLNQTMVAEMAAQWNELHSPLCRTNLDSALQDVVTSRALDPIYRAALTYATHSYC